MKDERIKAINNTVVIDLIEIKPDRSGLKLYNPATNSELGSRESYERHPFQAMVIYAPETYHDGGIVHQSEFKAGDVVLLKGYPIPERTATMSVGGRICPIIRYAEIVAYYTPTEKEVKEFTYLQDLLPDTPKEEKKKGKPSGKKVDLNVN